MSGVWRTDKVMSECVLLTYNRVIHTVMLKTPMPQTLGNGKTFLWSKYKCLPTIDQCMQKPSAPASSSWTATWDYSPAEIHYRGELTCLFQLCIRSPAHPHIFIQMYTITLHPWFSCLKAKKTFQVAIVGAFPAHRFCVCLCVCPFFTPSVHFFHHSSQGPRTKPYSTQH